VEAPWRAAWLRVRYARIPTREDGGAVPDEARGGISGRHVYK